MDEPPDPFAVDELRLEALSTTSATNRSSGNNLRQNPPLRRVPNVITTNISRLANPRLPATFPVNPESQG